jgi:protoporphyrinogen oxidase
MKILILGAGPCGLGAGYHLNRLGHADWQVFERSSHVGGLSASFLDNNGFTWDVGGHVLFSHYPYFDQAVERALVDAYYEHMRESWVRILGTWVPYPFQNNIRYLPDEAIKECVHGLRNLSGNASDARNFCDWMKAVFGAGIVKYFMEPYNRKVWGVPLESMSREWIGERVSVVDLARIERNILEKRDDVSWGPNNRFRFPMHGGTGAIFECIARPLREKIRFGSEIVQVDLGKKVLTCADGAAFSYDVLINSSPLDIFVSNITDAPDQVRDAAQSLVHNGGLIVGLGFKGARVDPKCWMYFPESDSPFYRVTNFYNYSPYNVPEGDVGRFFSLMCETTYSSYKPVDSSTIIEANIEGLLNSGMIKVSQINNIVSSHKIDIPYSYPVPSLTRDRALSVIHPFLESKGVYSRGRFGGWRYEVGNMDHSFMQGVEIIDRLLSDVPEKTFNSGIAE